MICLIELIIAIVFYQPEANDKAKAFDKQVQAIVQMAKE